MNEIEKGRQEILMFLSFRTFLNEMRIEFYS